MNINPKISEISEEYDVYKFTVSGINVSLANALRRIILSEIPTIGFVDNKCIMEENTSRLHNEILKQRLSCIPIHMKELDLLPDKYILEVDVSNETDIMIFVTTEDFKIKNKTNGNYLTKEETQRIFPRNNITQSFIDFARLRPKLADTVPGEKLKFTCEFSVCSAKDSGVYGVVSKCSYANTPDLEKINKLWDEQEMKLAKEDLTREEIDFQKKNFYILDAQRIFIPDSFDFIIQTIGVFDNIEIVKKGCAILQKKFIDMIAALDSDIVPIVISESTIDNSFDVVLENEDYTIGKVLEYILYEIFYEKEKTLTYVGFKKFHPHNTESIIRIAFKDTNDRTMARQILRSSCVDAQSIFKKIYDLF
jgi:DNA-directed RNA polymerase alpha subunit